MVSVLLCCITKGISKYMKNLMETILNCSVLYIYLTWIYSKIDGRYILYTTICGGPTCAVGVPRKRIERKCRRKDIWGNNVNFLYWIQQVQWTLSKINKKLYPRTLYRQTSEVGWWKRKSWKSSLGNQYIIHKVTLFWRMVDFSFFEKNGGKKIMKLTCIILKERKKRTCEFRILLWTKLSFKIQK